MSPLLKEFKLLINFQRDLWLSGKFNDTSADKIAVDRDAYIYHRIFSLQFDCLSNRASKAFLGLSVFYIDKIGSYNIFREVADLSVTAILAQANCSYCLCRAYIYFHLILLKCSLMYDLRRYWQILGFFLTDMKSVTKGTTHSFMNLYGSAKFFNVIP